jgi:hypothetical protein
MPDGDRLSWRLTRSWRKVLRCLRDREPMDRTEDLLVKAVASTLRSTGGVPELNEIAAEMYEGVRGSGAAGWDLGGRSTPPPSHIPTQIAHELVRVLAVTMQKQFALVSPEGACLMFAHELLKNLSYSWGLDRMVDQLVGDTKYSAADLRARFDELLNGRQMTELAKRLLKRPDAAGLRAPNRRSRPLSHDVLMGTDIDAI